MTRVSPERPDHPAAAVQRMAAAHGVPDNAVVDEAPAPFARHEAEMERGVQNDRADIDTGRFVEHDEVAAWLRSCGTERERPPPPCG